MIHFNLSEETVQLRIKLWFVMMMQICKPMLGTLLNHDIFHSLVPNLIVLIRSYYFNSISLPSVDIYSLTASVILVKSSIIRCT